MLLVLDDEADYCSWKRQVDAFFALKDIADDKKKLAVLPGLVSSNILLLAQWDGHATYASAMVLLEKAHDSITRPQDPMRSFESIQCSSNVRDLSLEKGWGNLSIQAKK